jgi:predicted  nucleic acid-binding Zn-ribbon protein
MPDIADLDKRIAVLETKDTFIMNVLKDNKEEHQQIINTLKTQSETLQGVKISVDTLTFSSRDVDTRLHSISDKQISGEKRLITQNTKMKVIWGIFTAALLSLVGIFIKSVTGCGQ